VGGEKHNRLFLLFYPLRACRTEKGALVPAGSGGKEAQQPILLFFTARAQDRNTRFGSAPFFFWFQPGGGKKHSRLFSFFNARVQNRKMRLGPSREWGREAQPLVLVFSTARACKAE